VARPTCALLNAVCGYGCEGHDKYLVALIVAGMQDPATPIFRAGRHDKRSNNAVGMFTGIGQIADRSAIRSIMTPRGLNVK
jgi:hypothetical protein